MCVCTAVWRIRARTTRVCTYEYEYEYEAMRVSMWATMEKKNKGQPFLSFANSILSTGATVL